jgi:hypothetical protein
MTDHALVTLSDSAAVMVSSSGQKFLGEDLTVQNIHASAIVYVGGEGVTAADYGYRLSPGAAISFEVPARDKVYAISDVNGSQVAVLRMGLENSKGA